MNNCWLMKWTTVLIFVLLLLSVPPVSAAPETIRFEVPVRIENLSSEVGSVTIECRLIREGGGIGSSESGGADLDSDGNLTALITIEIPSDRVDDDATGYECIMTFFSRGGPVESEETHGYVLSQVVFPPMISGTTIVRGNLD